MPTQSLSSAALGDSLIQRVESLMTIPYDKLPESDARERLELGSRRLREALCSIPWYAKKAAAAAAQGDEMEYWKNFFMSHVNMLHPKR